MFFMYFLLRGFWGPPSDVETLMQVGAYPPTPARVNNLNFWFSGKHHWVTRHNIFYSWSQVLKKNNKQQQQQSLKVQTFPAVAPGQTSLNIYNSMQADFEDIPKVCVANPKAQLLSSLSYPVGKWRAGGLWRLWWNFWCRTNAFQIFFPCETSGMAEWLVGKRPFLTRWVWAYGTSNPARCKEPLRLAPSSSTWWWWSVHLPQTALQSWQAWRLPSTWHKKLWDVHLNHRCWIHSPVPQRQPSSQGHVPLHHSQGSKTAGSVYDHTHGLPRNIAGGIVALFESQSKVRDVPKHLGFSAIHWLRWCKAG